MIVFDLSYRCNLECRYCNRDITSVNAIETTELKSADWIKIYQQLKTILAKEDIRISIEGGEPSLFKDLPLLLDYLRKDMGIPAPPDRLAQIRNARKLNYTSSQIKEMFPYFYLPRICVIINGTIIRSEILKNPPEELAISLHTPSKQFIKTVNFFSGHIFTTVMLPVSHHSPFQVAEILLTLKQVRFDNLYIFPVTPVGAAFKQGTWVSHDQYWQFLQAFLKDYHDVAHDSSNNPTVEIMVPSVFKAFLKLNHEYAGDLDTLSGTADIVEHSCNAFDFAGGDGLKKLTFTPSGNVTGCCIMSNIPYFHLGNVLSSPLKEILEGEKSREFQQRFNNRRNHFHCLSSPCNLKDICRGGCPVTAFLSTGDILTGDKCCPLTGIEGKN